MPFCFVHCALGTLTQARCPAAGLESACIDMQLMQKYMPYGRGMVWSLNGERRCQWMQGKRRCSIPSRGEDMCVMHSHRAVAEPLLVATLASLKKANEVFYVVLRGMPLRQQRDFLTSCLWYSSSPAS